MRHAGDQMPSSLAVAPRGDARRIGRIVALAIGAIGVTAGAVGLLAGAAARHILAYSFPHGTLGWAGAGQVLVDNGRLMVAPLAAAYVVDVVRPGAGGRWVGWRRLVRDACDGAIGVAVGANVFVVGASYGAYGMRMVRYTLPYAPVELLAFACPLAVYMEVRAGSPSRTRSLALLYEICAAGLLLLAAALMESLLPPL